MSGMVLGACSSDEQPTVQKRRTLNLVVSSNNTLGTRALPEGFVPYNTLYESMPSDAQIQGYLAKSGTETPIMGQFSFTDTDPGEGPLVRGWKAMMPIENNGTYYFYGFLPKEDVPNVSIAPYQSDYSKGAEITFTGLDAISPADICVFVGVKGHTNGTDDINTLDMVSRLGKFDIQINEDVNYAYLLANHIYCSLHFRMKVNEAYSRVRTIKVKQMKLLSNDGATTVKTVNAKVTLAATTDGTAPLQSVVIETNEMGQPDTPAMLFDNEDEPCVLTTEFKNFRGFMAPASNQTFMLQTIYDIYDRYGNLVRENCVAENKINSSTVRGFSNPQTGDSFTIDLSVKPSYLYQLSEPDLDDPTFTLE